ncbi:MAG: hypothetical protein IPQ05_05935 [Leptospiraceae bacterium]|nr:hypothetical protein [Leptospiraceae bacterium]
MTGLTGCTGFCFLVLTKINPVNPDNPEILSNSFIFSETSHKPRDNPLPYPHRETADNTSLSLSGFRCPPTTLS